MVKKKHKITQKESWYIFTICLLSFFLIASLGLFLQNPFTSNLPVSSGIKPMGQLVNIMIDNNGSNSQSVFFYGSLLPEFYAKQEVNITLKANQQDAVVRAKVFMYDDNERLVNLNAQTTSDWILNADGYYYYNSNLTANLLIKFINSIKIPGEEVNLNSSNIYTIIISIESLPATSNYTNIWNLN